MAVAVDVASAAVVLTSVTSASWSHTSSGADRLGVVGIGTYAVTAPTVSAITWGGVAMVANGTRRHTINSQDVWLWRHTAPGTASETISITFSVAVTGACGSVSYTGVNQTTPMGTSSNDGGTAPTGTSINVSSASGDMVTDTIAEYDDIGSLLAVGPGQTERWKGNSGGVNSAGASTEPGAASVEMSWSANSGALTTIIGANIAAAPVEASRDSDAMADMTAWM